MIVEDNDRLASVIQEVLENEGHEVRTGRDGMDGYLTYLLFRPAVIITDIHMPKKNGLEMMEKIRVLNPRVRTIYMSGDPSPFGSLLEEERNRYQVSILQKPFSRIELIRLVSGDGVNP